MAASAAIFLKNLNSDDQFDCPITCEKRVRWSEFLKEHKAFVEEQHEVEQLQATVANLLTTVKEQAAQIQKVSAQLELSKPAPETALNTP